MRRFEAIKRCEELTYENANLRKEIERLKEELQKKYVKIGNLIADNGRLIKANAYLADMAGGKPSRRRFDNNGDFIPNPNKP